MAGILVSTYEAAATLTVGTDAFRNARKKTSSRARGVTGIVVVGGNAINEASVDLYAGDYYFGRFYNTHSGAVAPIFPDDLQSLRPTMVAPGDALTAVIATAPTVSPLSVQVYGEER